MEHHRDRFAQAAGEWRDMTFSERIPYEDMARADKDRHQKDLDIASRNLNAALLGSVPKHGVCARQTARPGPPLPHQLPPAVRSFDDSRFYFIMRCFVLWVSPVFCVFFLFCRLIC